MFFIKRIINIFCMSGLSIFLCQPAYSSTFHKPPDNIQRRLDREACSEFIATTATLFMFGAVTGVTAAKLSICCIQRLAGKQPTLSLSSLGRDLGIAALATIATGAVFTVLYC